MTLSERDLYAHKWSFAPRFRRNAFGWRSAPAQKRITEAVAEIKRVAGKEPVCAAEGAVIFLEKVSPAIQQVDSSSGAIGGVVNQAITVLVGIIAAAEVDDATRDRWLERLWNAVEQDDIPYLELLPEYWGTLCVTASRAGRWADQFIYITREVFTAPACGFFKGTTACLSALFAAQRYAELLDLLSLCKHPFWHYRIWGARALNALNRADDALRYAEESRDTKPDRFQPFFLYRYEDNAISAFCEETLLSRGRDEEAYARYAIEANVKSTYLATFRAIAKKYPNISPRRILDDLVCATPGNEGKWFAAAKSAGLYDEAIALANRTPCDPKTLTRAARDLHEKAPQFALEAGMAALRWLVEGYGYEITSADVLDAYRYTMIAAESLGIQAQTQARIRDMVATEQGQDKFVNKVLGATLGLHLPRS